MNGPLLSFGLIACSLGAAAQSQAGERAGALVNSFQVMCTLEPLSFAQSDAKATAMRLPVRKNLTSPPNGAGDVLRSKSWVLPLNSGPHEFVVAEAKGPNGELKSCGIGAPDVDGDEFRVELTKTMRLGRPTRESRSADGKKRVTVWAQRRGQTMTLVDQSPKTQPGIYLLLMNKTAER